MAVSKLVFLSLVLVEMLLLQAMSEKSEVNVRTSHIKVHKEDEPGWVIPREAHEPGWVIPREAHEPASSPEESSQENREAEAPEIRRLGKHHVSNHGSLAGGGVIIGGLVTAIFAAVFAYIRVTRKKDVQH